MGIISSRVVRYIKMKILSGVLEKLLTPSKYTINVSSCKHTFFGWSFRTKENSPGMV